MTKIMGQINSFIFFNFYCIDLFSNNQNTKNNFIPSN